MDDEGLKFAKTFVIAQKNFYVYTCAILQM